MKSLSIVPAVFLYVCLFGVAGCEKKNESASKAAPTSTPTASEADWCAEHGVPESVCTKCNKKLIAEFKKKGDWCKEHDLPESQCTICNPDLKAKFEAMKPKEGK